jgi:hypothetical protein
MRLLVAVFVCACGGKSTPTSPPRVSFPETCEAIARDIQMLGRQYPQLASYHADGRECRIWFEYRTTAPQGGGGWTGATPYPQPDGIWFYIGIYDPNGPEAQSQIHTQPAVPNWWIGSRKVMFLLKEGTQTTRAAPAIFKVLENHGLETRPIDP